MPIIDIYLDDADEQRKRRKWLIPLLVGIGAALVLGRERPPTQAPPKPVAAPPATVVQSTSVAVQQTSSVVVEPPAPATVASAPLVPAHIAASPALLDFGDGPLSRRLPAQLAMIRNEGQQLLAGMSAAVDGPFMATSGCETTLRPGEQCMIAIVFTPKQPGRFAGSLTIAAGAERVQIRLRGSVPRPRDTGTLTAPAPVEAPGPVVAAVRPSPAAPNPAPGPLLPARMLCFEPALVRFLSTGRQTITLRNPGPTPLRVLDVMPIGRKGQTLSGYEIECKECLRVLAAGEHCKFTVRASRLALQTRETMQMTVYYDDPVAGGRRAARFSADCGTR